ncbi:restriction endonuclease subunit S [Shewanella subflava]|uniref:Restriction endonuclease subunit S n=1 Tax=Shewanella subflava TaxID=2986476 RepID=A0ABT3IAM5_9GAMM|nr:restriction endonuclease subunit S [Shewanella subflava]MCW3173111.1 restriction endonuclease subunit S [Shewanella subflava]
MSNWEAKTLGQFLALQRGYDLTADQRTDGNIPVMGAGGKNGTHGTSKASGPGVVIGRSGSSFGQVYLSELDFWPHNTSMYVTDYKGNDKYFTYYLLKNLDFNRLNSGSAQPSLNRNYIYPVKVKVPKSDEQKKISNVLRSLDKKIELNNRINAELEAMAKTLYDFWFVQFDFPDDSPQGQGKPYKTSGGKMVYNPILKREIPEGWEVAPLSSITRVSNESINPADYPEKLFKHFSIPVFDATNTFGVERGNTIGSNKFTVEDTDLLVSKLNPWFNRVVYAMAEPEQICSTEFVVWRCPNASIKNFMYMIATSPQFIAHCTQSATGTSNSHKRVNPNVMMRFDQPFNLKVAEKLGQHLEPILKQLIVNQRENTKLASLRDWLLPMLMNGQVTVK